MRTTTTQESKVLAGKSRSNYLRVKAKNASGAFVDLTTLRGYNWVKSAKWSESIDQYVATATIGLQRENSLLSLASLVAGSVLNSGGALLEIGREITIETATMPLGVAPGAGDWHLVFHGYIDEVDWEQTPVQLTCRDLAGQLLQDPEIQAELNYGTWEAGRALLAGYVQQPSGNPPNGQPATTPQYWRVTTPGTTGATEPAWPASPTVGQTLADGTVTYTYQAAVAWSGTSSRAVGAFTANPTNALQYWQCTQTGTTGSSNPFPASPTQGQIVNDGSCKWQYFASLSGTLAEVYLQQILNDNLGAGVVTLNVPAPSGWYLGAYTQSRDQVLRALTALTEAMGFDLRYWWNQSAGDYQLTLNAVPRTSPSVAWTFDKSSYYDVKKMGRSIQDIRNAVRVVFPDEENPDPTTGQPTRNSVVVTDAPSIAKYNHGINYGRFMEIAEDATGSIRTLAMATVLAQAALSDLKEPLLAAELLMPYFWAIQLNDYITVKANGVHLDADQTVAVVSIDHEFDAPDNSGMGKETTTLGLRGLPSGGSQKHLDKEAGAAGPRYSLKSPPAAAGLTLVQTVAGAQIRFTQPKTAGSKYQVPELHVSTSAGFTPTDATRKDSGLKSMFSVADLVPTTPPTTYRAAIVMRDQRGNVASKSAELSFTPGYAKLAHLDPAITQNAAAILSVGQNGDPNASGFAGPIIFDSVLCNQGSIYNASTGKFTIATTGTFLITARAHFDGPTPGDVVRAMIQSSTGVSIASSGFVGATEISGATQADMTCSCVVHLVAGQQVWLGFDTEVAVAGSQTWRLYGTADDNAMGCQMAVVQLLST